MLHKFVLAATGALVLFVGVDFAQSVMFIIR